jgi:hypothetical protein
MIGESVAPRERGFAGAGGVLPPAPGADRVQWAFARKRCKAMEAEQVNQIAGKIANLRERSADLRRYL